MDYMLPDFENSKVNVCADNIYKIWKETETNKSTQLVFCDLSTPKTLGATDNPYEMELVDGKWKLKNLWIINLRWFEDELAKGYTIEEQKAIEEIFRLDGMLDNLELKEAFKLGLREFFVFAIEQDLIKNNEKNSFLSIWYVS